ncbi:hypothetical protein E4U37_005737 [Claviceps purpurea]|nr:hypothetical protein E4U37_005737 [Claviceps purpurea]
MSTIAAQLSPRSLGHILNSHTRRSIAIPIPRKFTSIPAHLRPISTMADQQIIFTKDAPAPVGPYSQAIKTPTAIYCSGQIPLTAEGTMVEGSISEKTNQCCQNLEAVLKEAGSSIAKVVKCNIFLSSMDHFAEMNLTYEKWFAHKPARSCVAVKTLPKNVDVEIEAIALP